MLEILGASELWWPLLGPSDYLWGGTEKAMRLGRSICEDTEALPLKWRCETSCQTTAEGEEWSGTALNQQPLNHVHTAQQDTFAIPSVIFICPLETLTANLPEILRSIHIVSKLSQKSSSLKWETWYKNYVTTFQVLLVERITLKQIKKKKPCSLYIVHGNKNLLIQIN